MLYSEALFREHVRGSLVGWTEPENDFIEGLVGCDVKKLILTMTLLIPLH
jgi:hypothetical protein